MDRWIKIKTPHRPSAPMPDDWSDYQELGDPLTLTIGSEVIWPRFDPKAVQYAFNMAKKNGTHLVFHEGEWAGNRAVRMTVKGRWNKA